MKNRHIESKTFNAPTHTKYDDFFKTIKEWIESEVHNKLRNDQSKTLLSVSHSITHVTLSSSSIGGSGEWRGSAVIIWEQHY